MEPSASNLADGSPLRAAKRLFLAVRPMFLPASVLPVLLGTGWGYREGGKLDVAAAILALAATVCVHAGVNVMNDVYDDALGSDRDNPGRIPPYTGGSRFIQNGIMDRTEMRRWGLTLLVAGVLVGAALAVRNGAGVILFGAVGIMLGVAYSAPPLRLSAHGMGEIAVALGFGVLPVEGAAWLQSGRLSGAAMALAVPVSLWIANILLINEVPDAEADARSQKRTLVVRLGEGGTRALYLLTNTVALIVVGALVANGLVPTAALALPGALTAAAVVAARGLGRGRGWRPTLKTVIKITLAIHALGTLWLCVLVWSS